MAPSPMRLVAEIAPDSEEGPVAIELGPDRDLALPAGPIPPLGTTFTIDRRLAGTLSDSPPAPRRTRWRTR